MTSTGSPGERWELIWVVTAVIIGFRFAFDVVDIAAESLHPEITRFVCGSVLGFCLGAWIALAGLPVVHWTAAAASRLRCLKREKGSYERPRPTDSKDPR